MIHCGDVVTNIFCQFLVNVTDIAQREDSGGPRPVSSYSHCEKLSIPDILFEHVMILSASFIARCNFSMLMSLVFVLQTDAAYFSIDLPHALYVNNSVPLFSPVGAYQSLQDIVLYYLATCTE